MSIQSDFEKFIDTYEYVSKTTIKPFLLSDSHKFFIVADNMTVRTTPQLLRRYGNSVNYLVGYRWQFRNVTDKYIDDVTDPNTASMYSKELIANATTAMADIDKTRLQAYVETAIKIIDAAYWYKEYTSYVSNVTDYVAELLAYTGYTMIMTAMYPVQLLLNFADNAASVKSKDPDVILWDWYRIFTNAQWVPLLKYTKKYILNKSIIDHAIDIATVNGKYPEIMKSPRSRIQGFDPVPKKLRAKSDFGGFNVHKSQIRVLGVNLNKILQDFYAQ